MLHDEEEKTLSQWHADALNEMENGEIDEKNMQMGQS